jgi:hypothetical protein
MCVESFTLPFPHMWLDESEARQLGWADRSDRSTRSPVAGTMEPMKPVVCRWQTFGLDRLTVSSDGMLWRPGR